VLERVSKDGAWATPTLDGELARAGLEDRDRRLASELVYGVLRHRTRIDRAIAAHADLKRTPPRVLTALRVAAYQLLFLDRVPAYAAVDDAVAAARDAGGQKLGGFVNAVLRKLDKQREPALPAAGRERIEVEHSLPRWIIDELAAALGDDTLLAQRAESFAHSAPLIARVNTRRTTRDALIAQLAEAGVTATPIDASPSALALDNLGDPARNASFLAGLWTVQDTGAQLVGHVAMARMDRNDAVAVAAPPIDAAGTASAPGRAPMRILDACAGVGGKSTHLAELTDDAVPIDAADLNKTKLELCAQTMQRLGLTSIRRLACDLLDDKAPLADAYDLIVLDAPCTGLGVLRRHPDAKWRVQPGDVPRLADLQRQLLDAVVKRLAPGATLVYSVCTFTRAEGPDQVAALVARTGLRLVAEHRSWPPDSDAFYIARLER
jgi:16S rRNA (cytosine967-C5)-methyltransferase